MSLDISPNYAVVVVERALSTTFQCRCEELLQVFIDLQEIFNQLWSWQHAEERPSKKATKGLEIKSEFFLEWSRKTRFIDAYDDTGYVVFVDNLPELLDYLLTKRLPNT